MNLKLGKKSIDIVVLIKAQFAIFTPAKPQTNHSALLRQYLLHFTAFPYLCLPFLRPAAKHKVIRLNLFANDSGNLTQPMTSSKHLCSTAVQRQHAVLVFNARQQYQGSLHARQDWLHCTFLLAIFVPLAMLAFMMLVLALFCFESLGFAMIAFASTVTFAFRLLCCR